MTETFNSREQPNFQATVDLITERRLSPENLEQYADDALNDLVCIVDEVVQTYKHQPIVTTETSQEEERAAFSYYGLEAEAIEATLDHIAGVAESIHGLNAAIAKITTFTDKIITPPTRPELAIVAGSGTFHENQYIPRLKTLLFMLGSKYGIDIQNPEECTVLTGEVSERMMRNEPYRLVSLPTLDRNILVCDEESNATFVFDIKVLQNANISNDKLITMDKDTIRDFLNEHPGAGYRLTHSKYYIERLASLLEDIPAQDDEIAVSADSAQFLTLKEVPDEFMSRNDSAKDLGVSHTAIKRAADALNDELGTITMAKYKNGPAPVYSPEQRLRIKQWLSENGYLVPQIPDGYKSIASLPNIFCSSFETIRKAVEELGDNLGEKMRVRVGTNITVAYSPEQLTMIRDHLVQAGVLAESEYKDYLPISELAKRFGTSHHSVAKAIEENSAVIGAARKIRVGRKAAEGYSPMQQQLIRTNLESRGIIGQSAPEGFLTKSGLAGASGYSSHAIDKAIKELGNEIGEVMVAKAGTTNAKSREVYSPEQQTSIVEWMRSHGYKPTKSVIGSVATSSVVAPSLNAASS